MKNILLFATLFLSLVACAASPLLNHDKAGSHKNNVNTAEDETCPFTFLDVDSKNLCAKAFWIVGPVLQPTESKFDLKFWEKDVGNAEEGPYIDPGYDVHSYLWMKMPNGHEHPSSPFDIVETGMGVYNMTGVYFTMTGKWELHVQLKDGDLVYKKAMQPITIE